MTSQRLKELQERAVITGGFVVEGNYKVPRTWGVYKAALNKGGTTEQAFRVGNYPVRQNELLLDHGTVKLVLLHTSRLDAMELKRLLNAGGAGSIWQ